MYDDKRKLIQIEDEIEFLKEPLYDESIRVKVIGLLHYQSFKNLFEDFDINVLADRSMTKDELLKVLEKFYSVEKQKQYGVLGIRIDKTSQL